MPTPKFSFVPERQIGEDEKVGYNVNIYGNGAIIFNGQVVDVYELNNKYIKVFSDLEKKAIGWTIIKNDTNLEELNNARVLKKTKNGNIILSVTKILKKLGWEKGMKFTNLPVKLYKSPLETDDIWYIQLEITKKVIHT